MLIKTRSWKSQALSWVPGISDPRVSPGRTELVLDLLQCHIQLPTTKWVTGEPCSSVSGKLWDLYFKKINCKEKREWLVAAPSLCSFPVGEGAGRVCSLCIPEHKLGSKAGDFSFHNKENLYFGHWQRITESKEESVERARGCHGRDCLNKLLVTVMINPNF